MIVRHLHTVHELLAVLDQPTAEMVALRALLTEQGRFPSRRTWERRLKVIPATLPAQIGCLGRHLVSLIQPWVTSGRAVAIDSTVLRASGGVWHQKHRENGPRHLMVHVDGAFKLANPLVSPLVDSCTLLEKRGACENRASFQGLMEENAICSSSTTNNAFRQGLRASRSGARTALKP